MTGMAFIAALAAMTGAPQASQFYTEDLARCLVEKTAEDDKLLLIKWVFATMSASPDVQEMSTITDAERNEYHRAAAALFNRLLTKDCREKTVAAIKYNGASAIERSFAVLGEVAMRGLTAQPVVANEFARMAGFFDADAMTQLGREAGVPMPVEE